MKFITIMILFSVILFCSKDKNQVLDSSLIDTRMGDIQSDTLYPDTIISRQDENKSHYESQLYLANNDYVNSSFLILFEYSKSDTLFIDTLNMIDHFDLRFRANGILDTLSTDFSLSLYFLTEPVSLDSINLETVDAYKNQISPQISQTSLQNSDSLVIKNISFGSESLIEKDSSWQICILIEQNNLIAGQLLELDKSNTEKLPTLFYMLENDTLPSSIQSYWGKTIVEYKDTTGYHLSTIKNSNLYLSFDFSDYDSNLMLVRSQIVIPYEVNQSFNPGFSIYTYRIAREDWATTDSAYLIPSGFADYDEDENTIKVNMNIASQKWIIYPDSIPNYGIIMEPGSGQLGTVKVKENDIQLILNYSELNYGENK